MKNILLICGPLYNECMPYINEMIKNYQTIISTWNTEDKEKIEMLKLKTVDIILNTMPEFRGFQNINCSNTTICKGLKIAKEHGYEECFVMRTDNYINNIKKCIEIFQEKNTKKIVSIAWFNDKNHYYIVDYMMYGKIDNLIKYRSTLQTPDKQTWAEIFLQENYFKKSPVTFEDALQDFQFCLDKLIENNIEIYFTHHHKEQGNIINVFKNNGMFLV